MKKLNHLYFKTPQLLEEFHTLIKKNFKLAAMLEDVADYIRITFKKDCIVTSIFRTKEEQTKLYGYAKPSVHCEYRGIDIRSKIYTQEEIKKILEYTNSKYIYDKRRPEMKCCIYHEIEGNMPHFHFQNML